MILNLTAPILAAALLGSMILLLAAGAQKIQRISGWILAPAALCGLTFYTLGYLGEAPGLLEALRAVLNAVYTTCLMLMGRNDYSGLTRQAPWFADSVLLQVLFWLAHLAVLFVSASAVLSTLGKKLLQTMRLRISRAKTVYLIFGLSERSAGLGRDLAREKEGLVVYLDPRPEGALRERAIAFGAVVQQGPYTPNGAAPAVLLRQLRIGPRGRRLVALALDDSETANLAAAEALLRWLMENRIPPRRARISLLRRGEPDFGRLGPLEAQAGGTYDVDAFSDAELSARAIIRQSPPHSTLTFDDQGRAQEDFCALLIGFGQVGQHALRQLVMHGQFEGSRFSAIVVDALAGRISGQFARRYAGIADHYDIRFEEMDVRSAQFYTLLDEVAERLKYIVVCLGSDDLNYEITADLERYLARMAPEKRPKAEIHMANKRYVADAGEHRRQRVYSAHVLLRDAVDRMAMAVNFSYHEGNPSVDGIESAWREADTFSRESSRASADFIPAMLHMAGLTPEEAADAARFTGAVAENAPLLENLGRTEHLRWNAFHHAMGYTVLPLKEAEARARQGIAPVQKDPATLRHACLVEWDALDGLSQSLGAFMGRPGLDYKQMDRANIINIPRTLAIHRLLDEPE